VGETFCKGRAMKTASHLPTRPQLKSQSKRDKLIKTALMRDVLKVLEGTGHESAAKVLRGVFGEYE
jgi:hypothetical protein